ncbi:hypothetical protein DVH05_009035 [Phytophthora capsici]|nr:hypothetical protein DVH05_009035 [Phytophthora capsici]|eukprot:jgi/Phyca11/508081/fgenesh2_kg.PHYCAscaffold_32_\
MVQTYLVEVASDATSEICSVTDRVITQKRKVRSPTASAAKRIFHKNMELLSSP